LSYRDVRRGPDRRSRGLTLLGWSRIPIFGGGTITRGLCPLGIPAV